MTWCGPMLTEIYIYTIGKWSKQIWYKWQVYTVLVLFIFTCALIIIWIIMKQICYDFKKIQYLDWTVQLVWTVLIKQDLYFYFYRKGKTPRRPKKPSSNEKDPVGVSVIEWWSSFIYYYIWDVICKCLTNFLLFLNLLQLVY